MTMTKKEFCDLCDEFLSATPKEYDEASEALENSCGDSDIGPQTGAIGTFLSVLIKGGIYSLGEKLPESLGGQYFRQKMDEMNAAPNSLAMAFAEAAADTMLQYGYAPQKLAEKAPASLKTKEALQIAEAEKLSNMASIIRAGLN